nr:phage portal protein, PBSX family [Klebsiella pneumoniae]
MFGNAYLEKRTNRLGGVLSLEPSLAKYTRRGLDLDTYWFVQYGLTTQPYEFTTGSIFHLMEPDINRKSTDCPATSPLSLQHCSTSRLRCFAVSITSTAVTPGSSCT